MTSLLVRKDCYNYYDICKTTIYDIAGTLDEVYIDILKNPSRNNWFEHSQFFCEKTSRFSLASFFNRTACEKSIGTIKATYSLPIVKGSHTIRGRYDIKDDAGETWSKRLLLGNFVRKVDTFNVKKNGKTTLSVVTISEPYQYGSIDSVELCVFVCEMADSLRITEKNTLTMSCDGKTYQIWPHRHSWTPDDYNDAGQLETFISEIPIITIFLCFGSCPQCALLLIYISEKQIDGVCSSIFLRKPFGITPAVSETRDPFETCQKDFNLSRIIAVLTSGEFARYEPASFLRHLKKLDTSKLNTLMTFAVALKENSNTAGTDVCGLELLSTSLLKKIPGRCIMFASGRRLYGTTSFAGTWTSPGAPLHSPSR